MIVGLTAYRRPNYLRESLESWRNVPEVEQMVISLDDSYAFPGTYEAACEVTETLPFHTMVIRRAERFGVLQHPYIVLKEMFERHDFAVLAEEDIVVSSDIGRYFETVREQGKDDRALAACSLVQDDYTLHGDPNTVRPLSRFGVLTWGTWREQWERWIRPTWDFDYSSGLATKTASGWDWNLSLRVIPENDLFCWFPGHSRSQHIGEHMGQHCSPADFPETQVASFRPEFPKIDFQLQGSESRV